MTKLNARFIKSPLYQRGVGGIFGQLKRLSLRAALYALLSFAALIQLPMSSVAQEKKSLRIVFTGLAWNSELPFRAALARGFFKQQGLEIQPIFVRGGPAALAALSSGEVDFAEIGGAQAVMRSRARGLDVVIIGAISNAVAYQLVGSKSTRSLEELRGKIVGVTGAGAFSDFATRTFLRRKGIDPEKEVTLRAITSLPGPHAINATLTRWNARVAWTIRRL